MENEINEPLYFSADTLDALTDFESQYIKGVIYTYWVNRVDVHNPIKLLQYITFTFIDDTQIMLAANDDLNAIEISAVKIAEVQQELRQQFNESILLLSTDVTKEANWQSAITYPVAQVIFESNGAGKFYSDFIVIDFSLHQVNINISDMGLQINFENQNTLNN
ncbi:MAG: hypothetical protein JNK61_10045 [Bacteroidia bacterium]|nr:hypothetical protein [Bacteroidia bacterium]